MKKQGDVFVAPTKQTQKMKADIKTTLLRVTSFFPFDLFPDSLSINALGVTFTHNIFFFTSYQMSLPIEDIGDITLVKGPFFATLTINPTATIKDIPITMRLLKWSDADKAHNLLQGLKLTKKQKIDMSQLPQNEKIQQIEELGKV